MTAGVTSLVQCSVDVEDLSDESKKVDHIHHRVKYLHHGLRSMKNSIRDHLMQSKLLTTTTRQEIKMGFIAYDHDDDKFKESLFKSNIEMSLLKHIRLMDKRDQETKPDPESEMAVHNRIMVKKKPMDMKKKTVGWQSKFSSVKFASHTKVVY